MTASAFVILSHFEKINVSRREEHGIGVRSAFRTVKNAKEISPVQTGTGWPAGSTLPEETQPGFAARNVGGDAVQGAGDLCLGMAVGISPAQLVTFVASFREVAPRAELILFFEAPINARFTDIIDRCDYGMQVSCMVCRN